MSIEGSTVLSQGSDDTPSLTLNFIGYLAIGFVFLALFGKDILAEYLLEFSNRNFYGAIILLIGFAFSFLFIVLRGRFKHLISSLMIPLVAAWSVMLLAIAPMTAYLHRGELFISPQAVGFVAAIACYLVSPRIAKRVLAVTLAIQFLTLSIEYIFGFSFTPSINENLGYNLARDGWLIDRTGYLIRAKGLLDSTHDSTWLFIYSSFIVNSSVLFFMALLPAAWMAQARLGIMVAGALTFLGPRPVLTVGSLAGIALVVLAISPQKMVIGTQFFAGAFDLSSTSNTYRMEATKNSLDYLTKQAEAAKDLAKKSRALSSDSATERSKSIFNLLFGQSGIALVTGDVKTEMSYTLFLVEYGLFGFSLLIVTIIIVGLRGYKRKIRLNIIFSLMMAVLLFSSAAQSSSTFFMFWLAVLFLGDIIQPTQPAHATA